MKFTYLLCAIFAFCCAATTPQECTVPIQKFKTDNCPGAGRTDCFDGEYGDPTVDFTPRDIIFDGSIKTIESDGTVTCCYKYVSSAPAIARADCLPSQPRYSIAQSHWTLGIECDAFETNSHQLVSSNKPLTTCGESVKIDDECSTHKSCKYEICFQWDGMTADQECSTKPGFYSIKEANMNTYNCVEVPTCIFPTDPSTKSPSKSSTKSSPKKPNDSPRKSAGKSSNNKPTSPSTKKPTYCQTGVFSDDLPDDGPLDSCEKQNDCVSVTSTLVGTDVYEMCIEWQVDNEKCRKKGCISYACNGPNPQDKTDSIGWAPNTPLCKTVSCGEIGTFGIKDSEICSGSADFMTADGVMVSCDADVDEITQQPVDICHGESHGCTWDLQAPACDTANAYADEVGHSDNYKYASENMSDDEIDRNSYTWITSTILLTLIAVLMVISTVIGVVVYRKHKYKYATASFVFFFVLFSIFICVLPSLF